MLFTSQDRCLVNLVSSLTEPETSASSPNLQEKKIFSADIKKKQNKTAGQVHFIGCPRVTQYLDEDQSPEIRCCAELDSLFLLCRAYNPVL